jgi:hypothetical protein
MTGALDSVYSAPVPPDQQPTVEKAAAAASQKTSDTFVLEKSGLNVVASGGYAFSFAYKYLDPNNPSDVILGPRSANFRFTLEAPDYTVAAQNVVVTPGALSYIVKWDAIDKSLSTNKWFIDAQIYESTTGAFTGEEYLVWNGTGNTATILVSNTNNRWIRVDTRDQDYHKKSVIKGPFNAVDPIVVDTTGPANVTSVSVQSGIDTSGYLGFNAYADVTWPAVTGGGIRGYRIRFSNDNNTTYSYVDSPGTGTTYRLGGLAIGATYKIAVATYDEYNNTSSAYVSASDVTVTGTPAVTSFIKGGPFEFGVGVGSASTNKGLYFDASNYWYVNASNSARLKVGGSTSNYLLWDGSTFSVDGSITARGGTFSGNIFMSTTGASIYNGTVNTAGNLTGDGFALNSSGLKVAKGTNSITLDAANGTITANAGTIAGWTLGSTTLSKNNVILDSAGQIQVGATAATSVYIKSSGSYVMWAGNNTPDANAKFRVGSDGVLYATGATVSGNITANAIALGATYNGTSMTTIQSNAATGATALQPNGTLTGNVSGTVGGVAVATVTSGATKGSSAVQPGNGVTVDATTKIVNKIKASSGLPIESGGTLPVYIDGTGLYMKNALGQDTIFLDSSSGNAVFRGTVYAAAGEFTGKITSGSGSIGGFTIETDFIHAGTALNIYANGTITGGTSNTIYYGYANIGGGTNAANDRLYVTGKSTIDGSLDLTGNIKAQGTIYVGPSNNAIILRAGGTLYANTLGTGSGLAIHQVQSGADAGYLKVNTSTIKHKENINYIDSAGYLNKVSQLKPTFFNYKEGYGDPSRTEIGFIAEDLEGLGDYQQALHYNNYSELMGISYDKMTAYIVLAIKEIKDRLDALEG